MGTLEYEGGPGGGIFGQLQPPGRRHGHRGGPPALPGRHRQVGPDPAVQLAARRHGGPDPGLGPHPRRHHGHGRGLPAVPDEPGPGALATPGRRSSPSSAGVTAFVAATIACAQQDIKKVLAFSTVSQIGYMILAVGSGAYIAAIFLMVVPRLLQGPALPGGRLGDPRARRRAGPQAHGRPAQGHAVDHGHLHGGLAGHRRHPAARRASGPRATCWTTSTRTTSRCGPWAC